MAIIAKKTDSDFTPTPEGLHQGVCVDVIDLGMKESPWGSKHKVRFRWQVDEKNIDTDERFTVIKDYTLSLSDKANLRKDLESWRGRKFTEAELQGFDLESCLGANCQIQVVHNTTKDGRTFANVSAIVPIAKNTEKLEPENYVREVDREPEGTNGKAPPPDEFQAQPYEATYDDVPF